MWVMDFLIVWPVFVFCGLLNAILWRLDLVPFWYLCRAVDTSRKHRRPECLTEDHC